MRSAVFALASLAALSMVPAVASADEAGATAGAATGAVTGAVVGGPVGAAVGAVVGGAAGGAATGPDRPGVVVEQRRIETTRPANCSSTTVHKENDMGDSKTVHKETCD